MDHLTADLSSQMTTILQYIKYKVSTTSISIISTPTPNIFIFDYFFCITIFIRRKAKIDILVTFYNISIFKQTAAPILRFLQKKSEK